MRIEAFLERSAAEFGGETAVMSGRARHTFAELDIKSARLAAALQRRGVRRGDRVALYVDDGWSSVLSVFAALKAGAVVCPVDPGTDPDELAPTLKAIRPVAVVTETRFASAAALALATVTSVRLVVLALGDRTQATDTCLSLEDIVNRIGAQPQLADPGDDTETAVVLPGEELLSHAALVATAEGQSMVADIVPLARLAGRDGFASLVAAVRAGAMLETGPGAGRSLPHTATNTLHTAAL